MSNAVLNITLCMIIKNEEKYLSGCLDSVKDIADEIVIVDTGSIDNSLKIAESYGAKIFHFDWINDFSAARNFALSKSSGNYILYLDADERLSEESADEIIKLTSRKKLNAFYCNVESPSDASGGSNVMQYLRLFANHSEIRFTGKVHEQIEDSLKEYGYTIINSGIKIIHLGYDVSEEKLKEKAGRNLELLLSDFEINPSSYVSFQLGQTYVILGELLKAEPYFIYAVENSNLKNSQLAHCYRYLAAIESNVKNNLDKSLEYLNKGLSISGRQPLLNIIASNVYLRKNDFIKAEEFVRKAYQFNEEIDGRESNEFEIKIKSGDLINHVLNIAMLSCNSNLFNDFYKLYRNELNTANRNKTLILFNSVLNNYSINDEIIEQINDLISGEFLPAFIFSLGNFKNINSRISILEKLKSQFSDDLRIFNSLGNSYLEKGDKMKAFENYEASFERNPEDQALLFSLITLCVELNNIDKLLIYINAAEMVFKGNSAILEKLANIKLKLESNPT